MQIEVVDSRKLLGERVSEALRKRYGTHAAKQAARITGADLRTAQGWISESREPRGDALLAIIRELGRDAVAALFGPELATHEERLEQTVHALREEAARIEARIRKGGAQAPLEMAQAQAPGSPDRRVNHGERWDGHGPDRRQHRRRADDR